MNNLNVFSYGYYHSWYPSTILSNIKQFFRNIKYAYQRVTRGYCDQDIWNLDVYYAELFYQTLNKLADTTIGYPGINEFTGGEGFENWKNYLREMAEHFRNTQEYDDIPINAEVDRLFEEMCSYEEKTEFVKGDECFEMVTSYTDEEAHTIAKLAWLEATKNACKFRDKEKDKAFSMMKKYFFSLWD